MVVMMMRWIRMSMTTGRAESTTSMVVVKHIKKKLPVNIKNEHAGACGRMSTDVSRDAGDDGGAGDRVEDHKYMSEHDDGPWLA